MLSNQASTGKQINHLQNLHTHTVFCDGKNTPEELIREAISKGFDSIGFSGHSYMKRYPREYSMTPENNWKYRKEIQRMKEEYAGQIKVYCGMEADAYTEADLSGYDYLIGSAHYISKEGFLLDFDRTDLVHPQYAMQRILSEFFDGDGMKFAKAYYETLAQLPEHGNYDIIGHYDLIVKHNEALRFVDEESREYRNYAIEAAEALAGKIKLFEVNTGVMARGYRSIPYPAPFIIKELKRLGFGAVISSDCHKKENLDYGFHAARELLLECGFKEHYVLTDEGFVEVDL